MAHRAEYKAKLDAIAADMREAQLSRGYSTISVRPAPLNVTFLHNGSLYTATWSKNRLAKGACKLPSEWNFRRIPSTLTYGQSMADGTEDLLRLLRADFDLQWMTTSTYTRRNKHGTFDVIHTMHTSFAITHENAYEPGPDGMLDELADAEKITQAYFGTADVDAVIRAHERASGEKRTYFRRPRGDHVTFLGVAAQGFTIHADGTVGPRPARGVRITRTPAIK